MCAFVWITDCQETVSLDLLRSRECIGLSAKNKLGASEQLGTDKSNWKSASPHFLKNQKMEFWSSINSKCWQETSNDRFVCEVLLTRWKP